jgi:hypothetical protein
MTWEQANRWATSISAVAAVAATGVAVWAALPGASRGLRASRTGSATVHGTGTANTGVMGPDLGGSATAHRTAPHR